MGLRHASAAHDTPQTAETRPLASPPSVAAIDALLPQTQCRQCGYAGCWPYAEALAAGRAEINQCPPGGAAGVKALAQLLGRPYRPLAPEHRTPRPPAVARIEEAACIGCTLCIQACPVDAILGAARQLHTVLREACTGCALCLPPCPTACIVMETLPAAPAEDESAAQAARQAKADAARARFLFRQARLARTAAEKTSRQPVAASNASPTPAGADPHPQAAPETAFPDPEAAAKKAAIAAALARARAQRAAVQPKNVSELSPEAMRAIAAIDARRARLAPDTPEENG